jgi:CheY-like chemotaxis protein
MTLRLRLLEIAELKIEQRLMHMSEAYLNEYIAKLNSFVDDFPGKDTELKAALAAADYNAISKNLSAVREMLLNVYADELAEECLKQTNGLANAKIEKVEAYVTFLLSMLTMLSIDIQVAIYSGEHEEDVPQFDDTDTAPEWEAGQKSILAVDDNAFFLDALKTALQDTEYKLICVTSGADALRFIQKRHPDLFILDIEMPEMDGYELAGELRKSGAKAPIIFLTGNAGKKYVLKAMEAGAAEFIVKPINKKYVLERIGRII